MKERREYRNYDEEFLLSMDLYGNVIRQAFDDGLKLKHNIEWVKKLENASSDNYSSVYRYNGNYKKAVNERRASKDGNRFFTEPKRLERFITLYHLPLSANYIRRKYLKEKEKLDEVTYKNQICGSGRTKANNERGKRLQ